MKLAGVALPSAEEQRSGVLGDWKVIEPGGVRVPDHELAVTREFGSDVVGSARVWLEGGQLLAEINLREPDAYIAGDRLAVAVRVHEARHPGVIALCDLIVTSLTQQPDPPTQPPLRVVDETA